MAKLEARIIMMLMTTELYFSPQKQYHRYFMDIRFIFLVLEKTKPLQSIQNVIAVLRK
jgi:hypothetical protein